MKILQINRLLLILLTSFLVSCGPDPGGGGTTTTGGGGTTTTGGGGTTTTGGGGSAPVVLTCKATFYQRIAPRNSGSTEGLTQAQTATVEEVRNTATNLTPSDLNIRVVPTVGTCTINAAQDQVTFVKSPPLSSESDELTSKPNKLILKQGENQVMRNDRPYKTLSYEPGATYHRVGPNHAKATVIKLGNFADGVGLKWFYLKIIGDNGKSDPDLRYSLQGYSVEITSSGS